MPSTSGRMSAVANATTRPGSTVLRATVWLDRVTTPTSTGPPAPGMPPGPDCAMPVWAPPATKPTRQRPAVATTQEWRFMDLPQIDTASDRDAWLNASLSTRIRPSRGRARHSRKLEAPLAELRRPMADIVSNCIDRPVCDRSGQLLRSQPIAELLCARTRRRGDHLGARPRCRAHRSQSRQQLQLLTLIFHAHP